MGKVLALIENNIATTLLLSSHLEALGYQLIRVSELSDFSARLATQSFDWIILDDSAVRPVRRRLLGILARHGGAARLIWFGTPPRTRNIRLHATFGKPLRYSEIARFLSDHGISSSARDLP